MYAQVLRNTGNALHARIHQRDSCVAYRTHSEGQVPCRTHFEEQDLYQNKTHKGVYTVRRVETAGVAVQVEASVHVRSDVATDAFRRKIHFDDLLMFVIVVV